MAATLCMYMYIHVILSYLYHMYSCSYLPTIHPLIFSFLPLIIDLMFPTFQLSVSGCGFSFDPCLLQFVKELPLDAYTAGTSVSHGNEAAQVTDLPSFQTTPTITTPSVIEEEAKESEKINILNLVKTYATKVSQRE